MHLCHERISHLGVPIKKGMPRTQHPFCIFADQSSSLSSLSTAVKASLGRETLPS